MGLISGLKRRYQRWKIKRVGDIYSLSEAIFDLAFTMRGLSDQELKAKTAKFKERLKKETLDDILPEAFAVVREAVKRILGKRPYEEQVWAGIALHRGNIVEMKSGEGKTIAETMPVYLNALEGKGVHVVTSNDYLAQRDAQWVGPIFEFLGLSVRVVREQMERDERRQNYGKDITYVANQEVGFDYLRDNLVSDQKDRVLRSLNFAIIDEVDSILIDEARTPLIISQLIEHPDKEAFEIFADLSSLLEENVDYEVDEKFQTVVLTEEGEQKLMKMLEGNVDYLSSPEFIRHLYLALRAKALFQKDRDYLIKDGKVILIDEFTGRLMPDRRLMEGLHQAIEAKEKVKIREKDQILAKITFQNLFRLYKKFAGMTGTAETAKDEFFEVYGKEVFVVPTHNPIIRRDFPDIFYLTEEAKFKFITKEEVMGCQKRGRPVLVGTRSVEKALKISEVLNQFGIPHQLLTARHHEKEAEQIAQAGRKGMVTVATNMAGRGTDIILDKDALKVRGLHVVGTERHRARRIDDQLRGRAGRWGHPGSSRFHVSMEDELVQVFGSDKLWQEIEKIEKLEDKPFYNDFFQKEIEKAQKLAEFLDFDSRKWLYQFDRVYDRQRKVISKIRNKYLREEDLKKRKEILKIIDENWQNYLEELEALQEGIALVSYGGQDPLVEYALKTKQMFDLLISEIKREIANLG